MAQGATAPAPLPQPIRWTRADFARLADQGFLAGRRVQLVGGEVVEMGPMKGPHAVAIDKVGAALRRIVGPDYSVRQQLPLALNDFDEPEPDTAVVVGEPDDYVDEHPTTAALVVEISDTTLAFDRGRKAHMYAAAAVPEYWIVNLVDRTVEVRRQPMAAPGPDSNWDYATTDVTTADGAVTSLAFPARAIPVQSLLPRRPRVD
ncbi:MAG: Uma2 family endonuclease [Chloroflexi bacterium]|nr:Uma2 family endonuclease [Chloroflexota bacterium]